MELNGRKKLYIGYDEANDENIATILSETYPLFVVNKGEIDYLFKYYKGIQPILSKEKKVRPEINNKIVENHANSIVQFKTGYLLEKPIQYVARKDEVDDLSLTTFNDYLEIESKESKDKKIAHDQAICGVAYRLVLVNKYFVENTDTSPFRIINVEPQNAYVVYSSGMEDKPILGVIKYKRRVEGTEKTILQAYSNTKYWVYNYDDNILEEANDNAYGYIPLIEYPYSEERIGAFEAVLPLLDAINLVQSNRVDGVEQFIQALLVFKNADINKEQITELLEMGAIKITDNGEVKANVEYLTQELNQEQVQKLKDDLVNVVYDIVGMPNRSKSGGGDTGTAVIYRNGWEEADSKIQDVELMFKESEKQFLKVALSFTKTLTKGANKLKLSDLEIKFTRKNYENTLQKAQILNLMLKNNKIAPRLAFVVSGLFQDSEGAYNESKLYYEEEMAKAQKQAELLANQQPKQDNKEGVTNE